MNQQSLGKNQSNLFHSHQYIMDGLRTISRAIHQGKHLQQTLDTVTTELQKILQSNRILIYHKTIDRKDILLSESLSSLDIVSLKNIQYNSWNSPKILHQLQEGKTLNASDVDSFSQAQRLKFSIQSELIVPILVHYSSLEKDSRGKLWGLIVVHQCYPRQWQPFELDFLSQVSVQTAIAIQQSQLLNEFQALQEQLKEQEVKDILTQIANDRYFNQVLEVEWKRLQRESSFLSLLLCKIDGFKHYNEVYGNEAGDSCLQLVASILLEMARRPADLVARYNRETFAVLLPNTNLEGSVKVAEAIRTRIHVLQIPHRDFPVNSYVTLSLGVTSTIPTPIQNAHTIIQLSEEALKQAVKDGNRVLIFSDS
ncbi:MAG: sensor domain-containing diguanylate cyclase [Cyanobacteriota bacterium]|nr:sensor domain-containing diguanylate cyclase [Cyanobacteriota bacterium]